MENYHLITLLVGIVMFVFGSWVTRLIYGHEEVILLENDLQDIINIVDPWKRDALNFIRKSKQIHDIVELGSAIKQYLYLIEDLEQMQKKYHYARGYNIISSLKAFKQQLQRELGYVRTRYGELNSGIETSEWPIH